LTGLLEAIEASGPASLLRTSFYLYPVVNALHILALGVLVTSASLMDLRVLGIGRALPAAAVLAHLRPVAIASLALAIVTGSLLFSVRPFEYAANPAFRIKLVLLALATANALAFVILDRRGTDHGAGLRLLAGLSLLLWPCVLLSGRFIGFMEQ
jgi:hypothetical protein